MGNFLLTYKQVYWAHRKWCEGHSKQQIAKALYCSEKTLTREFKRYGLNYVEIPLKYEEGTK